MLLRAYEGHACIWYFLFLIHLDFPIGRGFRHVLNMFNKSSLVRLASAQFSVAAVQLIWGCAIDAVSSRKLRRLGEMVNLCFEIHVEGEKEGLCAGVQQFRQHSFGHRRTCYQRRAQRDWPGQWH